VTYTLIPKDAWSTNLRSVALPNTSADAKHVSLIYQKNYSLHDSSVSTKVLILRGDPSEVDEAMVVDFNAALVGFEIQLIFSIDLIDNQYLALNVRNPNNRNDLVICNYVLDEVLGIKVNSCKIPSKVFPAYSSSNIRYNAESKKILAVDTFGQYVTVCSIADPSTGDFSDCATSQRKFLQNFTNGVRIELYDVNYDSKNKMFSGSFVNGDGDQTAYIYNVSTSASDVVFDTLLDKYGQSCLQHKDGFMLFKDNFYSVYGSLPSNTILHIQGLDFKIKTF
jgi:hypothetical protein